MYKERTVWVRGAGELASGVGTTLHRVGLRVIHTELPEPLAIRRTVCFSDAVFEGKVAVEEVEGCLTNPESVDSVLAEGKVAVLIDDPEVMRTLNVDVLVDARMTKRSDVMLLGAAPFTVGLGPGFVAGKNCDVAIETMRGHNLGRVIWSGGTKVDTGVPGNVGGQTARRVMYAQADGAVDWHVDFGDIVSAGQSLGKVGGVEVLSTLDGMVRGLISPRITVKAGTKIADVDPRGESAEYRTISEKASSIGRGVLEAILVRGRSDG